MATKEMQVVPISGVLNKFAYESEDTLTSAGNGVEHLVPVGINNVSITLKITAGSGKVQFANSSVADVKAGNGVYQDWDEGTPTVSTSVSFLPVTAIRQVNVSGMTQLLLRAQ